MKKTPRQLISYLTLVITLAAVAIFGCRCATTKPNPLDTFHFSSLDNLSLNKAITDDYKIYIKTLTAVEQKNILGVDFYEDEEGKHAVKIEIGIDGTWWSHVLIYNSSNTRIKVMKYSPGTYRS